MHVMLVNALTDAGFRWRMAWSSLARPRSTRENLRLELSMPDQDMAKIAQLAQVRHVEGVYAGVLNALVTYLGLPWSLICANRNNWYCCFLEKILALSLRKECCGALVVGR